MIHILRFNEDIDLNSPEPMGLRNHLVDFISTTTGYEPIYFLKRNSAQSQVHFKNGDFKFEFDLNEDGDWEFLWAASHDVETGYQISFIAQDDESNIAVRNIVMFFNFIAKKLLVRSLGGIQFQTYTYYVYIAGGEQLNLFYKEMTPEKFRVFMNSSRFDL